MGVRMTPVVLLTLGWFAGPVHAAEPQDVSLQAQATPPEPAAPPAPQAGPDLQRPPFAPFSRPRPLIPVPSVEAPQPPRQTAQVCRTFPMKTITADPTIDPKFLRAVPEGMRFSIREVTPPPSSCR
jgi:hypothetical protein